MSSSASDSSFSIFVDCHTCHERMEVQVRKVGRQIECPECGRPVRVPDMETALAQRSVPVAEMVRDVGEYALGEAIVRPPPETRYLEKIAEIRRDPPPPIPRWTFFSGTFNFPWRRESWLKWLSISLGLLAIGLIALVVMAVVGSLSDGMGAVLAFFVLPEVWLCLWTFSFSASCGLKILESTAAGMDAVDSWPEASWRDWMVDFLYFGWLLFVAATAGFLVGRLLSLAGASGAGWWPVLGGVFFLGPVFILSALEGQSMFVLLAPLVLRSLVRLAWAWVLFYVLAALLLAGLGLVTGYLAGLIAPAYSPHSPLLAVLLGSPLLAACLLILPRLLGRLAWKVSHTAS